LAIAFHSLRGGAARGGKNRFACRLRFSFRNSPALRIEHRGRSFAVFLLPECMGVACFFPVCRSFSSRNRPRGFRARSGAGRALRMVARGNRKTFVSCFRGPLRAGRPGGTRESAERHAGGSGRDLLLAGSRAWAWNRDESPAPRTARPTASLVRRPHESSGRRRGVIAGRLPAAQEMRRINCGSAGPPKIGPRASGGLSNMFPAFLGGRVSVSRIPWVPRCFGPGPEGLGFARPGPSAAGVLGSGPSVLPRFLFRPARPPSSALGICRGAPQSRPLARRAKGRKEREAWFLPKSASGRG